MQDRGEYGYRGRLDEDYGRGRQQWERMRGEEDYIDRGLRRPGFERDYTTDFFGRTAGEGWRGRGGGPPRGRWDYDEDLDIRRGTDMPEAYGYERGMSGAPQGYDRGFGQDYGWSGRMPRYRGGMESEDYAYWQTRLGERGGRMPEQMSRSRIQAYPFGGGWQGPDVEEYQSMYGARGSRAYSRGPYAGRGPKGYQRSDDRIREDACEALSMHGDIDASEIDVRVSGGEITLTGTVEDRRQKRMAEDVLDGIVGVRDVHNQLHIQPMQEGMERMARSMAGAGPMSEAGREAERAGTNARTAARSR